MEVNENFVDTEISFKFETFRLIAEETEKKCRALNFVIENLKVELNLSRDLEKRSMNQLKDAQKRIIRQQRICNELVSLKKKFNKTQKEAEKIQNTCTMLNQELSENKTKIQHFIDRVTEEDVLKQQILDLKQNMEKKEADYDLINIEIQTLKKENESKLDELMEKHKMEVDVINMKYETQLIQLNNRLSNMEAEKKNIQTNADQALLAYRKQLTECQQIVARYEAERAHYLAETPTQKKLIPILKKDKTNETEPKRSRVTWAKNADSTSTNQTVAAASDLLDQRTINSSILISHPEIHSTMNFENVELEDDFEKMEKMMKFPRKFGRIGNRGQKDIAKQLPQKRKLYTPDSEVIF